MEVDTLGEEGPYAPLGLGEEGQEPGTIWRTAGSMVFYHFQACKITTFFVHFAVYD